MVARWEDIHAQLAGPVAARSEQRRHAGKVAHDEGLAFEAQLDELHKHYRHAGRAVVVKVPAPYRVVKKLPKGRFTGAFEAAGPPDYAGVIEGRAVAFDAKQTSGDRWSFDLLADHQARYLDGFQLQDAFAFLVLTLGGRVWVVPWTTLGPRWWAWHRTRGAAARGTASLSEADLDAIGHRCVGCDWLPVVVRLLGAP